MPTFSGPDAEALLRRRARRVQWGLMAYLLLLLLIGIGVLRLALTTRRFDRLTVTPAGEPAAGAPVGRDDSAPTAAVPVNGEVP